MAFFNEFPHTRTYDSDLGWMIKYIKDTVIPKLNELLSWQETHTNDYNELKNIVENLENDIAKIESGNLPDAWYNALKSYLSNNFQEVIMELISFVFFGLTDDGYFAAYISKNLSFISFDTEVQASSENYGRLILKY